MLNCETLDGIHMTGWLASLMILITKFNLVFLNCAVKSFCELTKYLLDVEKSKAPYLLSEHFSQDPLENYFGQQRYRGGWCQNPTVQACLSSAQSLRVLGSLALMPVRGNSSRKKRLFSEEVVDNTPLPKRARSSSKQ